MGTKKGFVKVSLAALALTLSLTGCGELLKGAVEAVNGLLEIGDANYDFDFEVTAPLAVSPDRHIVEAGEEIKLITTIEDEGAAIYYTLSGMGGYQKYTKPLKIETDTTIQALVMKNGEAQTDILTRVISTESRTTCPTSSLAGGNCYPPYAHPIELSCSDNSALIFYTLDGSNPRTSRTVKLYEEPVYWDYGSGDEVTIKFFANSPGYADSKVKKNTYLKRQVAAPIVSITGGNYDSSSGSYDGDIEVTLTSATPDAIIRYTLSTYDPQDNSNNTYGEYSSGQPCVVSIDSSTLIYTTLTAIAVKDNMVDSDTLYEYYTIDPPQPEPEPPEPQ